MGLILHYHPLSSCCWKVLIALYERGIDFEPRLVELGAPQLLPQEPEAQLQARLWDRLFDLYVMDPMQRFIAQRLRPKAERDAGTGAAALATLAMAYGLIEERMGESDWAAGDDFGLADCAAAPDSR
jgi:glutathione S-transferase